MIFSPNDIIMTWQVLKVRVDLFSFLYGLVKAKDDIIHTLFEISQSKLLFFSFQVAVIYIIVCVPDPKNQSVIERANSCSRDQSSIVRQFIHTVSVSIEVKILVQCDKKNTNVVCNAIFV